MEEVKINYSMIIDILTGIKITLFAMVIILPIIFTLSFVMYIKSEEKERKEKNKIIDKIEKMFTN